MQAGTLARWISRGRFAYYNRSSRTGLSSCTSGPRHGLPARSANDYQNRHLARTDKMLEARCSGSMTVRTWRPVLTLPEPFKQGTVLCNGTRGLVCRECFSFVAIISFRTHYQFMTACGPYRVLHSPSVTCQRKRIQRQQNYFLFVGGIRPSPKFVLPNPYRGSRVYGGHPFCDGQGVEKGESKNGRTRNGRPTG